MHYYLKQGVKRGKYGLQRSIEIVSVESGGTNIKVVGPKGTRYLKLSAREKLASQLKSKGYKYIGTLERPYWFDKSGQHLGTTERRGIVLKSRVRGMQGATVDGHPELAFVYEKKTRWS